MTGKPATRQSVADGRALYAVAHPATKAAGATEPSLEDLLGSPLLLGRTRARAARGDHTARAAVDGLDQAWRALNQAGGDDNDAA